jgi:hypothetical protein
MICKTFVDTRFVGAGGGALHERCAFCVIFAGADLVCAFVLEALVASFGIEPCSA